MPWALKRYYGTGGLHFITWSCYRRRPVLDTERARDLLLTVLELMRERYRSGVVGYVVMPEHMHMLISEPQIGDPSIVVQAVKLGFTQRWRATTGVSGQFWQRRFYDFNVWSQRKEVEKLKYMHRNPVVRGLVESPTTGGGAVTGLTRMARMGRFGSATGGGGRKKFETRRGKRSNRE